MFTKRNSTLATGAAVLLAITGAAIPASVSYAAKLVDTPLLSYDLSATVPSAASASGQQDDAVDASQSVDASQANSAADSAPAPIMPVAVDAKSVECMAKVVMHEAGNQPREGKVAVAQTLVNRLNAGGRFGDSICSVVNQKGQFFHIASFQPRRDTDGWQEAVEISHEVLAGHAEPIAPGAMYFRASYAPANAFFRTRQRVTTVGAHIFYR